MNRTEHFVQFYESDDFIVNSVAEYVTHGLKTGETCIVIATNEHLDAIERRVESFGVDLMAARESEAYIAFDAASTLAKFMDGDRPDPKLFSKAIGALMRKITKRGPVRAFGEMVALLVQDGNPNAAVELERLWNGLRRKHPFSLFCAYPMHAFATGEAAKFMGHVCDGHSRVIPDETYTPLTSADERLRQVAFLQQRGRQLEAELAELEHRIAARKA
jgi:KaiC/GvpD/RAD55 family RecA-like ATPase